MRVVFASGIDGPCHRYTVLHWAEQLEGHGVGSTVRAHTDPRLLADLAVHDVLVLYRVPDSAWVRRLLAGARDGGVAAVFAVDDLIVDPALADAPPLRRLDAAARRLWLDGVERYRRTLLACDALLVPTPPLGELGRALGKPTYIHPAGLADCELALGAAARAAAGAAPAGTRLGYFSGTPTHDDDFATIAPVLAELLETHPALALDLVGPLAVGPALERFGARVTRRPLVAWPELPALVAHASVCLAPLEWRHPFVAAKSAVKYLEAAAVEVPTVASPTPAFRAAIADGVTGLLAADGPAWKAALERLIADPGLRARLGAAARADVAARCAPAAQGPALVAALSEIAAEQSARRPPARTGEALDEVGLARAFPGEVARAAREPRGYPGFAAVDVRAATPPLGDRVLLTQRFHASGPHLARVDVHTVTYGLALDHVLEMRLRRDDGRTVATVSVPAALAPDHGWLPFEFAPDPDSAGHRYTVELTARGTGSFNALSFGITATPGPQGPFVLGPEPGPGSLALRTFADERAAEAAARVSGERQRA